MFSVTGEEIFCEIIKYFNLHVNKSSRQTISSDLSHDLLGINNIKTETKGFKTYYDIIPLLSIPPRSVGRGNGWGGRGF
jgi:hypothetical protein